MFEFLTDECVSDHNERIRSIQIDKFFFRGHHKSSQKLAKRITLVSFSTPSLPPWNEWKSQNRLWHSTVGNLVQKRVHVLPALLNVVGYLRDNQSLVSSSSNEGVILRAGMFHVQEWSWNFCQRCHEQRGGAHIVGDQLLHVKTQFQRGGKNCCLVERILQCLRSLCTVGSSGDTERQAWRRLVGKNDGSTWVCPTGAVARVWYRWCGGRGKPVISKFSILALICVEPWQVSSTLRRNSSTACLSLYRVGLPSQGIRWTCPPHPFAMYAARSSSSRFAARPSGARCLRAALFFFFEACFAKTFETPCPPNKRTSFRKLLRTFETAPYPDVLNVQLHHQ